MYILSYTGRFFYHTRSRANSSRTKPAFAGPAVTVRCSERRCVYCAVLAESLYTVQVKGLNCTNCSSADHTNCGDRPVFIGGLTWPGVWTLVLGTNSGRLQNWCWIKGKVNTGLSTTHTSAEGKRRLEDQSVDSLCPAQDSLLCLWEEEPLKRVSRDSVYRT